MRLLLTLVLWLCVGVVRAAGPSVAFFYGAQPPWDELKAFDVVVVEPDHVPDPRRHADSRSALFAYVSVGEVTTARGYYKDMPASWRIGENTAWGSAVVDQSQPEWPAFFAERVVRRLVEAGYQGLFLDTLDSFHLVAKTDEARTRQQNGMIALVRELRRRYPQLKLMFNRGFEILPAVHSEAYAVAAESLYRGWDNAARSYREVPPADREWLLGQLNRVKNEYRLPVIAIDYVAPAERALARKTAERIKALGFIPWVSNPELDALGVGAVEVVPRRVLMLFDGNGVAADLAYESIHRYVAMPLNHLGYRPEYVDVLHQPLPAHTLAGRYAGIVSWFDDALPGREAAMLQAWLSRQVADGIPVVFLNSFGLPATAPVLEKLGIAAREAPVPEKLVIAARDPQIGREAEPILNRRGFMAVSAKGAKPLLTLRSNRGETMDAVAYTDWGGYALNPYAISFLPGDIQRWIIDPIEFLQQALRLPRMPVPDTTTENGRRLLLVHIDGDGFANQAELPGAPFASEVLLREVLERYRVPTTMSVIQGETAANGLYPQHSARLEDVARRMFALPHIEIASHSYSHPFFWQKATKTPDFNKFYLPIPGYTFDLRTEINGSVQYINSRLAPAGKKVKVFLWTGDTNPDPEAVRLTYAAGIRNMNGGETTITESNRSLTLVAPLGIPKGPWFQVYAPNQNENIYTNLWTGPYYGFDRVIETFRLTDVPRRLKPINIYYHTYSASKPAALVALHKVYQWALAQPVMPVHASEYVDKVLDFQGLAVARDGDAWLVRGNGELRGLRVPAAMGQPDLESSTGIAGYAVHNGDTYIHLTGGEARFKFTSQRQRLPMLASANGRISAFERRRDGGGTRIRFEVATHVPLRLAVANAQDCELRIDGVVARPVSRTGDELHFESRQSGARTANLTCPR